MIITARQWNAVLPLAAPDHALIYCRQRLCPMLSLGQCSGLRAERADIVFGRIRKPGGKKRPPTGAVTDSAAHRADAFGEKPAWIKVVAYSVRGRGGHSILGV